jgi:heme exporter protein B
MFAGFIAILRKDLRLELRTGESTIALIALSLLILVVLVLAFGPGGARRAELAAGALWIALIFAAMLGATRSLLAERESGCIRGLLLSPVEPATIFAAKLTVALIFMAIAGAAVLVMLMLFFNLDFGIGLLRLLPVFGLGTVGLAAVCTLLAAISGRVQAGGLLLPAMVIPIYVPALIAGTKASAAVLAGQPLGATLTWLKILGAFDVLFVVAGYLLFEHVVLED